MEITKVYKESMPDVKLVGKRYTNEDRDKTGTFAEYWQQAFREGWFDTLKQCAPIPGASDAYLGMMRFTGEGQDFEYRIGCFFAPGTTIPDGFEAVDIPAGEIGVCWLYGNEKNGELYSAEASDLCMAAMAKQGWSFSQQGWFFERYICPRFTSPDEHGNVILDICAYLASDEK